MLILCVCVFFLLLFFCNCFLVSLLFALGHKYFFVGLSKYDLFVTVSHYRDAYKTPFLCYCTVFAFSCWTHTHHWNLHFYLLFQLLYNLTRVEHAKPNKQVSLSLTHKHKHMYITTNLSSLNLFQWCLYHCLSCNWNS